MCVDAPSDIFRTCYYVLHVRSTYVFGLTSRSSCAPFFPIPGLPEGKHCKLTPPPLWRAERAHHPCGRAERAPPRLLPTVLPTPPASQGAAQKPKPVASSSRLPISSMVVRISKPGMGKPAQHSKHTMYCTSTSTSAQKSKK